MHMVIRVIVYADEEEEALSEAKSVLDELCGDGKPFDYYTTFDDKDSPMSGPGRWGPMAPASRADSPEGKHLIDEGMSYTKNEFMENISKVREVLGFFSDEELFNKEMGEEASLTLKLKNDEDLTRDFNVFGYYCHCLYRNPGADVWLYDQDGDAIGDPGHLKNVLNKWDDPKRADKAIFVVPADVHY